MPGRLAVHAQGSSCFSSDSARPRAWRVAIDNLPHSVLIHRPSRRSCRYERWRYTEPPSKRKRAGLSWLQLGSDGLPIWEMSAQGSHAVTDNHVQTDWRREDWFPQCDLPVRCPFGRRRRPRSVLPRAQVSLSAKQYPSTEPPSWPDLGRAPY